jgi:O-antigen ligase
LILTYVLIYFTDSRAGLALALAVPVIFLYMNLYRNNKYKFAIKIVNYFLFPILIFSMVYYLYTLLNQEISIDFLTVEEGEGSTLYRLLQLQKGGEAIMNSPVFGYSPGGELTALDDLKAIDNNYLSIALSSGLVGLSIYIYINVYVLKKGIKAIKIMKDEVMVYFLTAFILLLLYYFILSINKMNVIYYIMVAIILIRYKNLEKSYSYI